MNNAKRCTQEELAYLDHWRSKGYAPKIDEPIPLNTVTPPQFATRHPILDALAGALIVVGAILLGGMWLAYGAGLMG